MKKILKITVILTLFVVGSQGVDLALADTQEEAPGANTTNFRVENFKNQDLGGNAKVFVGEKGNIVFNPIGKLPSELVYGPKIYSGNEKIVEITAIGKGDRFSWQALKPGKVYISSKGNFSEETINAYLEAYPQAKGLMEYETSAIHDMTVYNSPTLSYSIHGQNYGWQQGTQLAGTVVGTTGKSLRLEALQLNLDTKGLGGDVEVRVHGQKYGWQAWNRNGQIAGTTGKGLRIEAIELQLTGEIAKHFDIVYRVHGQNYGWETWKKNGEIAGTTGKSLRLEALEIQLVRK